MIALALALATFALASAAPMTLLVIAFTAAPPATKFALAGAILCGIVCGLIDDTDHTDHHDPGGS